MTEAGKSARRRLTGHTCLGVLGVRMPAGAFVSVRDQTDQLVDPIWLTLLTPSQ